MGGGGGGEVVATDFQYHVENKEREKQEGIISSSIKRAKGDRRGREIKGKEGTYQHHCNPRSIRYLRKFQ